MTGSLESLDLILSVIIDDEPACQSAHERTVCSIQVTHRARWCQEPKNLCENAATHDSVKRVLGATCRGCGLSAFECWQIYPI